MVIFVLFCKIKYAIIKVLVYLQRIDNDKVF